MAAYYLDTSALVKRYAREQGTAWIVALTAPRSGHDLYIVRLTGPEMISALTRKARIGGISVADSARRARMFRLHWQHRYLIIEVTSAVIDRAMDVGTTHGLRGYDAVHLAAALAVEEARRAAGLPALTFQSSDDDQCKAALAEGLRSENPNMYP